MCYRIRTCIMCGKENADEFYPEGTLYRNVKNEKQAVKDLQTMLTDCGYLNDKIDGVFGKKTEQAVKSFQADAGIKADGIAWPQTISRLNTEWELMMGFSATPAPVVTLIPKPVATATPGIVFETEEVYDRCSCIVNPDGSEEIVYCENHQTLVEMGEALMAAATTDSLKTRALNQMKSLWTEEMNLLYDGWIAASGEADQETIINGRKMFEAYAEAQEALWKMQYRNNSAAVAEKVVELLVDQCVSLCGIAEVSEGANASTPKGYVGVSLVDGWYVGEPKANDAITLHNDGVGPNTSTWITITDTQTGAGIEQAKQIVMFAYVGGEFTEIEIGDNSFHYIANSDGTVFTLIAETSTGKAMKVDGRNCTLEQAMSLLETIVIC
ncbi:MAG: peptidoglycan-binding protein [Clostridiales bacterium]|nr:peptidoglycan-binding protein [Clostridiales bacterium]